MQQIITFIKRLLKSKKQADIRQVEQAVNITRDHHPLSKTNVSVNALKVLNRLCTSGYDAYIVGGSVRDLVLHQHPKDFDIATNATPNEVRGLFKNSRIIGRRFRLVHVLFHREMIEVATFRSSESSDEHHKTAHTGMVIRDNVYGNIEQDAWRRDFTINALYYDHRSGSIIDFTDGFADLKSRTVRIIGDPITRYKEDPVRMLRAIRFAAKLDFELSPETAAPIKELAPLLSNVSSSRLFDEVHKLYHSGYALKVNRLLKDYGLFEQLFPQLMSIDSTQYPMDDLIHHALENTDNRIQEGRTITPAFLFAVLLWFPLIEQAIELEQDGMPPLPALEKAMSLILSKQQKSTSVPKRLSLVVREMWLLQYRFPKRYGIRPFKALEHPRFRAAYDFLLLRALAGDESVELADWWSAFQEVPLPEQRAMIKQLAKTRNQKP